MSFCSFIEGYLDGVLADGEISVETEFIAGGSIIEIETLDTSLEKVYEGGTYFFENDFYKDHTNYNAFNIKCVKVIFVEKWLKISKFKI